MPLHSLKMWHPLRRQIYRCFLMRMKLLLEYWLDHKNNSARIMLKRKMFATIVTCFRKYIGALCISYGILNMEPFWSFFSTPFSKSHCACFRNKIKISRWPFYPNLCRHKCSQGIREILVNVTYRKSSKSVDHNFYVLCSIKTETIP